MPKQISPKIVALIFGVLVICFLAAFYVVAWQEPASAPPGGNVATPLNTSNIGQSKQGGLILNTGGALNGLIIDKGNLCLGTDCRSSWPAEGGGVIITYHMDAVSYQSGNTYYSQTKTYNCPEGSTAVQTYCKTYPTQLCRTQADCSMSYVNADACNCSVSGRTATVKAYASGNQAYSCMNDYCYCQYCYLVDSCTPGQGYTYCGGAGVSCTMEFQCGAKQTVGE